MRICTQKSTGRVLEMQSAATEGTLIANAVLAGYSAADTEERLVTSEEYEVLLSAQPKTPEELAAEAKAKLADIDLRSIRAIREHIVAQPDAPKVLKDRDAEAAAERAKLK